ncbi:MAG: DUF523 domain-containing protein [Cellulosilyticum sp.]|nr:DUF523 domain-containing protein [Cellulosilyticum sp.]
MILVSSCLCGEKCKYNGGDNYSETVMAYCKDKEVVPICPEVMGGLSIPRSPAEIIGGTAKDVLEGRAKVISKDHKDITSAFIKGAKEVLEIIKGNKVEEAILKANSPSCGKGMIYDGSFSAKLIEGNGLTAQVLLDVGIKVRTEKDLK